MKVKETKKKISLFLDSGAYSAFTKNINIDIKEYIAFIKKYEKHLEIYANLDVIGDPKGTLNNQKIMEKSGLSPLPCFHYGEPVEYLKGYVKNYKYIALGGMVPISTKDLTKWLDDIFSNYICDNKGISKIKVHGFGLTSFRLMVRYPWYSVDSTSWVMGSRMGVVYVPRFKSGKWIYDENSWKMAVSNKSTKIIDENQHIDTLSFIQRRIILSYFKSKGYVLGKSEFFMVKKSYDLKKNEKWADSKKDGEKTGDRKVEKIIELGLCNDYKKRDELNIIYFMDFEKSFSKWPPVFKLKQRASLGI